MQNIFVQGDQKVSVRLVICTVIVRCTKIFLIILYNVTSRNIDLVNVTVETYKI